MNLLLEGSHINLKHKQVLLSTKEKLLGQLAGVAFCSTKAKTVLELPNFPREMAIKIAAFEGIERE